MTPDAAECAKCDGPRGVDEGPYIVFLLETGRRVRQPLCSDCWDEHAIDRGDDKAPIIGFRLGVESDDVNRWRVDEPLK